MGEDFTKEEYVAYVDEAVNKPDSIASTTLYNYLLTLFVEADVECKGRISYEQFDGLVEIAAASPRHFGLAPAGRDAAERRRMFDAIDGADGFKPRNRIAMGQFLNWSTSLT